MRNKVSPRQTQILGYITDYKAANDGISPTLDEIKDTVGLPSASSVLHHIIRMDKAGFIIYKGVRNIRIPGGKWVRPSPSA